MELVGMALDKSTLEELGMEINDYTEKIEKELYRLNGKRFQINSPKVVAQILQIRRKNGTMAARCKRADLEKSENPMAKLILEHRKLTAILRNTIQLLLQKLTRSR